MKQGIKAALWGCLEIPLFMKIGVTRFVNDQKSAIYSFLIPLIVLIPTAELGQLNPDFTGKSYSWLFMNFGMIFIISSLLFFTASYISMWALEKKESFFSYVNGFNWMNITSFTINLPFYVLVYTGIYSFEEMFNLFIFLILFTTVYQAYFITHLLKINWMLGAAISIMGMLSDDLAHKIVFGTS